MNIDLNDTAIIQVILDRFEKYRLPRIMEIKEKTDNGETLNEFEIAFLSEAIHDARSLLPVMDRHPEYEPLLSRVIHYYKLVCDQAVANAE